MRKTNRNRQAFTLAEIMIVLLIVTIIFAAFAPIFTGRVKKTYRSIYSVWSWADKSIFDAYTSTDSGHTHELFFGVTPSEKDEISTIFAPLSKVVIRAGNVTSSAKTQRQIQFRYGRSNTNTAGTFAGTWLVDGTNYLLGGTYNQIGTGSTKPRNNTALGYNALSNIKEASGNTAIGYSALMKVSASNSAIATNNDNVAVGYMAGYNVTHNTSGTAYSPKPAGRNTLIGANAGLNTTNGYNNVAIGYRAMAKNTTGYNNTYIGAYAAGSGSSTGSNNVAVGYSALRSLTSGKQNVAIGYNALGSLTSGSNNVAIGYNACSEVTTGSNKTCIGYNSGPHEYARTNFTDDTAYGTKSTADFLGGRTDDAYRTYIGSRPYSYGGDAVLEIHNLNSINYGIPGTDSVLTNTTTVINGNLIVRGRPYFTVGGRLHHFYDYESFGDDNGMRINSSIDNTKDASVYYYYGYHTYNPSNKAKYLYRQCSTKPTSYRDFEDNYCMSLRTDTSKSEWLGTYSDRRLKHIDGKFTYGLDKLRNIRVYNYTFKNDKEKSPHVGVIAQELQKVFPTAVFQGEDGYLRIRWDEMFYAMINGIKEIDRRIVALVKRTNNVETQISQLEKENLQLKKQVDNLTVRVNKLKAQ